MKGLKKYWDPTWAELFEFLSFFFLKDCKEMFMVVTLNGLLHNLLSLPWPDETNCADYQRHFLPNFELTANISGPVFGSNTARKSLFDPLTPGRHRQFRFSSFFPLFLPIGFFTFLRFWDFRRRSLGRSRHLWYIGSGNPFKWNILKGFRVCKLEERQASAYVMGKSGQKPRVVAPLMV